jgi:hypothetical protein
MSTIIQIIMQDLSDKMWEKDGLASYKSKLRNLFWDGGSREKLEEKQVSHATSSYTL